MNEIKNGLYEDSNGNIRWYKNDELHREDGPAIEWGSGTKEWIQDGQYHREDGPAIEYANGDKFWRLNGKLVTQEEFNHWLEKKKLNEKLESNLEPKLAQKRTKI